MSQSSSPTKRVVIAGAGCAGLAAGLALQKRGFDTVILERSGRVGGLAGGVEINGNTYEYGPHIFHTTDPEILQDVKTLCTEVLEPFERTIKIKFGKRYFDYPLSPFDILTKLPPWTVAHACSSLAWHWGPIRWLRPSRFRDCPASASHECCPGSGAGSFPSSPKRSRSKAMSKTSKENISPPRMAFP